MARVSVAFQRMRYLRRRGLDGLTRGKPKGGSDPGVPRLKKLRSWLSSRSTALGGTGTSKTFTADQATNRLTITGHGYSNGSGPFEASNSGGGLPAGLSATDPYWTSVVDVNTVQLHLSAVAAATPRDAVEFTDAGTGTQTLKPRTDDLALAEHLRQGVSPGRLQAETDIDNLI